MAPNGNDSNSATSPSAPWASIAKVNATRFNAGDVIYFESGGVWREMLSPRVGGAVDNPVAFATYGSGSSPIISGSDIVSGWSLEGGQVYSAPLGKQPFNVYVDAAQSWGLTQASSASAMTAGSWYWDGSNLLVWLSDGSNPANHTIEAATRVAGFYITSGHCAQVSNLIIDGLTFERAGGYGIYLHCYSGPDALTGIVIENNTVSQTGTGTVDGGQYYNAIHFLQEPWGADSAPQILGNTVSFSGGHGNGIEVQGANNAYIAGNDVSVWNHNGIDVKNACGVVADENTIHDQPSIGSALYAEYASVTWQRNTIRNVSNAGQISVDASIEVYNNSIYNASTGFYFGPSGTSVQLLNNALNETTVAFGTDGSTSFSEDYNDWGTSPAFEIGTAQYKWSRWENQWGGPHDIAENPMWDAPALGLFDLLVGSPCIAAGEDVGLPFNGLAPNIGAWQQP